MAEHPVGDVTCIIIIIKLYFRHKYVQVHRDYATGKIYSTVRQCFLNLELKSVLATVFRRCRRAGINDGLFRKRWTFSDSMDFPRL